MQHQPGTPAVFDKMGGMVYDFRDKSASLYLTSTSRLIALTCYHPVEQAGVQAQAGLLRFRTATGERGRTKPTA